MIENTARLRPAGAGARHSKSVRSQIITFELLIIPNVIKVAVSITLVKTFGDRLRYIRKQRDMTQKELAHASGLSQSAIGNYESGQRSTSRAVFRLAAALDVVPEWLDHGHGPMQAPLAEPSSVAEPGPGDAGFAPALPLAWPFSRIAPSRYQHLTPQHKQLLEKTVQAFIDNCHAEYEANTGSHRSR